MSDTPQNYQMGFSYTNSRVLIHSGDSTSLPDGTFVATIQINSSYAASNKTQLSDFALQEILKLLYIGSNPKFTLQEFQHVIPAAFKKFSDQPNQNPFSVTSDRKR